MEALNKLHEVLCDSCDHMIARGTFGMNQWGDSRVGMVNVSLLLKRLKGECPNCKTKLTLKDYEVEIIRI